MSSSSVGNRLLVVLDEIIDVVLPLRIVVALISFGTDSSCFVNEDVVWLLAFEGNCWFDVYAAATASAVVILDTRAGSL